MVDQLIFGMQYDPSALVRRNIVESITVTNRVRPYFVQRVMDVEVSIRAAIFKKINAERHLEIFTKDERLFMLKSGLMDRYSKYLIIIKE